MTDKKKVAVLRKAIERIAEIIDDNDFIYMEYPLFDINAVIEAAINAVSE